MQPAAPCCKFVPGFLAFELSDSANGTGLLWHTLMPLLLTFISSKFVFPTLFLSRSQVPEVFLFVLSDSMMPLNFFQCTG